jgi:chromosome partitioning protein
MKKIVFLNNKDGVGKTSLVYNLAWMYNELGIEVLVADFDPQANLTAMFLDESRLRELWEDKIRSATVWGALKPLLDGTGKVEVNHIENITDNIALLPSDFHLALLEDELSKAWFDSVNDSAKAFELMSAFHNIIDEATRQHKAQIVLIDVGSNFGALTRAATLAADFVITPIVPDIFALEGLRNLGAQLKHWRTQWTERLVNPGAAGLNLPKGVMQTAGYVVIEQPIYIHRNLQSFWYWMDRIPALYQQFVQQKTPREVENVPVNQDANLIFRLKNYHSLVPLATEARKPLFLLKFADGAGGSYATLVRECYQDYKKMAEEIARRCDIPVPQRVY